jgi:hypothetical protein
MELPARARVFASTLATETLSRSSGKPSGKRDIVQE